MATYGLKYESTFDPVGPVSATPVYKIEIYEKDYGGSVTDVICSAVPVLHQWQTDDPKAPIKGSSLTINLINQNGNLPLESFFSIDDDQFQVIFYWGINVMFIGFLVQDDCSESLFDYTHEINLSATDNLGLLKDVALDKAKIVYDVIYYASDTYQHTAPHTLELGAPISALIQPGDYLEIYNLIFTGTYHIVSVSGTTMTVSETVGTDPGVSTDLMRLFRPILFDDKVTLATVLNSCLAATGLTLNTYVFCNFLEVAHDASKNLIVQTLVDPQTFLKDEVSYDNCYAVLEKIMKTFKCSFFQARGSWYIVHWDEVRYSGYPVPGYYYDSDFTLLGTTTLNSQSIIFGGYSMFQIGVGEESKAETGLLHKVLRPLLFDKETFNYKQPAQLLRNFNLQQVGALLNTYTTGSGATLQTIKEYSAPWWVYDGAFSATFFIRVITDSVDNEIERSMVVIGNSIHGYKIEICKGDSFTYSFSFKTDPGIGGGPTTLTFQVVLTDGTTTNWVNNNFTTESDYRWGTTTGLTYTIQSGDDTSLWHTVEITPPAAPFDGLLYCYLDEHLPTTPAPGESIYKDIRFEAKFLVNQSAKIIGQTHKTEQDAVIKQTQDEEIFLDDSPRNSIAGTLFLPSMVGVLQKRTSRWNMAGRTDLRLGDLATFEGLFWRRIVRSILEGTYYGLISPATAGDHVSMLSVFNYTFFPGLNFVAGTMEIDYRNNKFSGTLWELCTDTEVDADLTSTYEFKYLYSTK